jgi:Na+:H+ antiporter, NhaA family
MQDTPTPDPTHEVTREPPHEPAGPTRSLLFGRGRWPGLSRISEVLRRATVGGTLLPAAAPVIALVGAHSPWSSPNGTVLDFTVGPESLVRGHRDAGARG